MVSLASSGVSTPQAVATGIPASSRTFLAIGARKAGPQGIFASGVLKPTLTLTKSVPISLNCFTSSIDSLNVCSSSPSYSITPKRTVSGRFSGQTARTALSVSSKNRPRPCASPPYSSVRLLACFEKKLVAK